MKQSLAIMEDIHALRCDGYLELDRLYRNSVLQYAEKLIKNRNRKEIKKIIVLLEEEAANMQEQVLNYWELCDNNIMLGEMQEDYNKIVAKHIELLDLAKEIKRKTK